MPIKVTQISFFQKIKFFREIKMGLRKIFSLLVMDDRGLSIAINKKRKLLALNLNSTFKNTIKYGPFKGMVFTKDHWWGASDRSAMLLGIYEEEILNSLMLTPRKYNVFVNIGAADGYYSIGSLISRKYTMSYAFEISAKGRDIISKNAALNKVSKKIKIFGEATKDFYKDIPKKYIDKSVILIDIEGAEFSLLNRRLFEQIKNSIIFVELHDWSFKDGKKKLEILMTETKPFFKVTILKTTSRDLSKFPELSEYSDSDRWLIASEGRPRLMSWLRLDPR